MRIASPQEIMIVTLHAIMFLSKYFVDILHIRVKQLSVRFFKTENDLEDDEPFADYDDDKGVVFFPSVCSQRYAAVINNLKKVPWFTSIQKVVDLGCHDTSFITILKDLEPIRTIIGVDLELTEEKCLKGVGNLYKRMNPLDIKLFRGNAADNDINLLNSEAVIAIELIEHMLPQDLDVLVSNIFGYVKPSIVIITTPNGEFNVLFKIMLPNGFRRDDHFFEWTRKQFQDWAENIVLRYPEYSVHFEGIGPGPPDTTNLGCCSQMAVFTDENNFNRKPFKKTAFTVGDSDWCETDEPRNYQLVKEFKYPQEQETCDQDILEVISNLFKESSSHLRRNKIPFAKVMESLLAQTNDQKRVSELLEWNGYEVTRYGYVIPKSIGHYEGSAFK